MMNNRQFLSNQCLIAMPNLTDPNFSRTVTYICEHNENGAVGIIINRPLDIQLEAALLQMNIEITYQPVKTIPLLFGGPIQQDRGFVLHRPDAGEWRSTLKSSENISITTSKDILEAIARGDGPKDVLVALGYAGWGANQLEQEILNNVWLNCPADPLILFDTPQAYRWQVAVTSLGIDLTRLSYEFGHA